MITVSGVSSMCSIKSEFRIRAVWLSLVTFYHSETPWPRGILHIDEKPWLYIPMWANPSS